MKGEDRPDAAIAALRSAAAIPRSWIGTAPATAEVIGGVPMPFPNPCRTSPRQRTGSHSDAAPAATITRNNFV